MIEKIFQKLLNIIFPNRKLEAKKIRRRLFLVTHDVLSSLEYSLKGSFSYEEVQHLNSLTGFSARYGFCPQKGPVAFIGIPNPNADKNYFHEVNSYGEIPSDEEFEFQKYPEETAKKIINYTVYGLTGINEITSLVQFDRIGTTCDSRYKDVNCSHEYRVLKMKAKLEGSYTFQQAENLTRNQERWSVDRSIAYATLEDGKHVAIMSFWYDQKDEVAGFRDVWESGKPEPATKNISFLTDEQAKDIRDFSIYLYDYTFFYVPKKATAISKLDRTLIPGFDFYDTPDGKDLRLSNFF